jgi:prepilin-type N-terminal cleavage/methylation domain-containing protein
MSRANQRQHGYSLIELIVVVGMIGVITLVAIPAMNTLLPQYRASAAASEIAGALRMSRTLAMSTRNNVRMILSPTDNRWCLQQASGSNWIPLGLDGKPYPYTDNKWKDLERVDMDGGSVFTIVMERDGTIESGSTQSVVLNAVTGNPKWLQWDRYTVNVLPSGYVSIAKTKNF